MWCDTNTRRPRARAIVDFSSAPQASSGRDAADGSVMGAGAYPRLRRSGYGLPSTTRTTESSTRMWIGRS